MIESHLILSTETMRLHGLFFVISTAGKNSPDAGDGNNF